LDDRDQLHSRAAAWQAAVLEPLLITEYVVWEFVNAFSATEERAKAHATVSLIRSHNAWQIVIATTDLFESGLRSHQRHVDKSWSLTDCISFSVMRERGITRALTHDHHFEQAGFEAQLRRDPP
jgi:predicted nucleic acid-binding protein